MIHASQTHSCTALISISYAWDTCTHTNTSSAGLNGQMQLCHHKAIKHRSKGQTGPCSRWPYQPENNMLAQIAHQSLRCFQTGQSAAMAAAGMQHSSTTGLCSQLASRVAALHVACGRTYSVLMRNCHAASSPPNHTQRCQTSPCLQSHAATVQAATHSVLSGQVLVYTC